MVGEVGKTGPSAPISELCVRDKSVNVFLFQIECHLEPRANRRFRPKRALHAGMSRAKKKKWKLLTEEMMCLRWRFELESGNSNLGEATWKCVRLAGK